MSETKSSTKIKKIRLSQFLLFVLISAFFLFLLFLISGCKIDAEELMRDKPLGKVPTTRIISVMPGADNTDLTII